MGYKKLVIFGVLILIIISCSTYYYIDFIRPQIEFKKYVDAYLNDVQLCPPAANKKNTLSKGFAILSKKAIQNDVEAQYYIGSAYLGGVGVEGDEAKGIDLIKQAAINNLPIAESMYGYVLETYQDKPDQAISWYFKAAKQGDDFGKFMLALKYILGNHKIITAKQYTQFLLTASNLSIDKYYLGQAYQYGNGFPQDINKAIYWYTQTFNDTNAPAILKSQSATALAVLYWHKSGAIQPPQESNYWVEQSKAVMQSKC